MNELAVIENDSPPTPSPEALIRLAIEKGASVEALERLMAIRRELKAEAAKEAFFAALSQFQSECPTIEKTKKVLNKDGKSVRYAYAPLESIVQQVSTHLKANGFSYTLDSQVEVGSVKAVCVAHHVAGHSETFTFAVPVDNDAYMSPAQRVGSALTFASRYAFRNAFGILTGDEDDDANGSRGAQNAAGTTAPPSTPTSTPKTPGNTPASAAKGTVESPEERKTRFLALFKDMRSYALEEFLERRWILDTEDIEDIDPVAVPRTLKLVNEVVAAVKARAGVNDQIPGAKVAKQPSTSPSVTPAASAPVPDLIGCEKITGIVAQIAIKDSPAEAKKPWTRYGIRIGEVWLNTFHVHLGQQAEALKDQEATCYYKAQKLGNDLVWIQPITSDITP